jgi:hypothetical protein
MAKKNYAYTITVYQVTVDKQKQKVLKILPNFFKEKNF